MPTTTFTKRFKELVRNMSDTELGYVLGVSADAARKMRVGDIKSLKLQSALRLARKLDISPWFLAGEPEPESPAQSAPSASRTRKETGHLAEPALEKALQDLAERVALLHDEVVELRARVRRLEAAPEEAQPRKPPSAK